MTVSQSDRWLLVAVMVGRTGVPAVLVKLNGDERFALYRFDSGASEKNECRITALPCERIKKSRLSVMTRTDGALSGRPVRKTKSGNGCRAEAAALHLLLGGTARTQVSCCETWVTRVGLAEVSRYILW